MSFVQEKLKTFKIPYIARNGSYQVAEYDVAFGYDSRWYGDMPASEDHHIQKCHFPAKPVLKEIRNSESTILDVEKQVVEFQLTPEEFIKLDNVRRKEKGLAPHKPQTHVKKPGQPRFDANDPEHVQAVKDIKKIMDELNIKY